MMELNPKVIMQKYLILEKQRKLELLLKQLVVPIKLKQAAIMKLKEFLEYVLVNIMSIEGIIMK